MCLEVRPWILVAELTYSSFWSYPDISWFYGILNVLPYNLICKRERYVCAFYQLLLHVSRMVSHANLVYSEYLSLAVNVLAFDCYQRFVSLCFLYQKNLKCQPLFVCYFQSSYQLIRPEYLSFCCFTWLVSSGVVKMVKIFYRGTQKSEQNFVYFDTC